MIQCSMYLPKPNNGKAKIFGWKKTRYNDVVTNITYHYNIAQGKVQKHNRFLRKYIIDYPKFHFKLCQISGISWLGVSWQMVMKTLTTTHASTWQKCFLLKLFLVQQNAVHIAVIAHIYRSEWKSMFFFFFLVMVIHWCTCGQRGTPFCCSSWSGSLNGKCANWILNVGESGFLSSNL